ncbi:hypothetical protein PIIN_05506 [Serendipita indica DSM 11827]|uniref:Uncharacterized protein n=1 Tax=Serendipita indica (strain DSM 11827) TaxID=1109443 RepID=G4TJS7_SERID|nr:hypothetical protein PIIN_05506 [Serendipita indica DSM 11827]
MFPRLVAAATVLIALLATPASSEQTPLSTGNDHDPYSDALIAMDESTFMKFSSLPTTKPAFMDLGREQFCAWAKSNIVNQGFLMKVVNVLLQCLPHNGHSNPPWMPWLEMIANVTFTNDDASKKVTIMRDAAGLASYMSANETMTSWNTHSQCIEGCGRSGSLGTPGWCVFLVHFICPC